MIAVGITALVVVTLQPLLVPGAAVVPGTDASNLYASELYTRAVFALGRLPHWNPYLFGGTPHLADTQTIVLYPPAMLLRWIPASEFFSWLTALHLCIAGIGAAFLARTIGLGSIAAAAAAVALTLGGSNPGWVYNGHLLLLYAAAWLPWVIALIVVSAKRVSVWPHPALVAVLVMLFLAGSLQAAIYVAAAALVCVGWLVAYPPEAARGSARFRPIGQLAIAGILAAGLAAFQLLPTVQLVSEMGRIAGLPYSAATRGAWSPHDLASFFFPFTGLPAGFQMRFMADHTAYVGWVLALAIPFAFVGREHRRKALFFGGLTVGCVAFVMADALPFYRLHYLLFPGLRIPGRMLFIATLGVAMLGALGVDSLLSAAARRNPRAAKALAPLLLLLVVADLLRYSDRTVQAVPPGPAPVVFEIQPGPGRTLALCDHALGVMDLVMAGRSSAEGVGGAFLRDPAAFETLALEDGPLRMRRDLIDASNVTSIVSCAPIDAPGLHEVGRGATAIVYHNDTAWPRALWTCGAERVTRREAVEQLRDARYDGQHHIDRRHFVNVRWAASLDDAPRQALESRYHLTDGERRDGNTWRYDLQDRSSPNIQALLKDHAVEDTHGIDRGVAEMAPGDLRDQVLFGTASCRENGTVTDIVADVPGGDVALVSNAPTDGLVFLSEPYYPERVAFVDNAPVMSVNANVAFTAVPVSAGRHVVELRYVPRWFNRGLVIGGVTLLTWIGFARWLPRQRGTRNSAAG